MQDENSIVRHFEPLISKNKHSIGPYHQPIINITTYKETEHGWMQIDKSMASYMVKRFSGFKSVYGEFFFETKCQLMDNEYDVSCLQHIIA